MRKIIALTTLTLSIALFVSCGGSGHDNEFGTQGTTKETSFTLVTVNGILWDPCNLAPTPHGLDTEGHTLLMHSENGLYDTNDTAVTGSGGDYAFIDLWYTDFFPPGSVLEYEFEFSEDVTVPPAPDRTGYKFTYPMHHFYWNFPTSRLLPPIVAIPDNPERYRIGGNVILSGAAVKDDYESLGFKMRYYSYPLAGYIGGLESCDEDGNYIWYSVGETCHEIKPYLSDPALTITKTGGWSNPIHTDADNLTYDWVLSK